MSGHKSKDMQGVENEYLERLEKRLKETQERFELAMYATKDGLWDWDMLSDVVYYSPNWKLMLGFEDHELESHFSVWESHVHPEDRLRVDRQFIVHLESQDSRFDSEFRMRHKDGHWVDILSRANIFFDDDGKAVRLVGTHIDITKRKKIKQQLEDSELRWKYALEGNDDGVWDWNLITNEIYYSARWKSMLGFEEHEIQDSIEEWERRVHPDDLKRTYEDVRKHLNGEVDTYVNEHRILDKEGRYVWILDRGKVIQYTEEGKPLRMIGTHTDITERKNAELELKRLNEEKSKYFSVLAHDLRNLIGSSSQLSELIASGDYDNSDPTVKELGGMLYQRNRQSLELLESLLQWGRLTMKLGSSQKENFSIKECAEMALKQLSSVAENKSLTIELVISKELYVMMDINLIITVFRNLLFNAIKYSQENNKIIIGAADIGDYIEVSVRDFGVGMSEDVFKNLFSVGIEPVLGTFQEKGTGFGLVVCKEIITNHGGVIRAESKKNEGSVFCFSLPKA